MDLLTTIDYDVVTTLAVITPLGITQDRNKAFSRRQQFTVSITHTIMADLHVDQGNHHHEPADTDHAKDYHLHVHFVVFTSWFVFGVLASVEIVVYLITLLIIRLINRTRSGARSIFVCFDDEN